MVRAVGGRNGLQKFRVARIAVVIHVHEARLRRGDEEAVALGVVQHFQRHALLSRPEVVDLVKRERHGRRVPHTGPERAFHHVGDVNHGRGRVRRKHHLDRRRFRRRFFRRHAMRRKHRARAGLDHRDGITRLGHVGLDRAGDQHAVDPVVNRYAVRIPHGDRGAFVRPHHLGRLIRDRVTHDDRARTHTGEEPDAVVFRHHQILQDLALWHLDGTQAIRKARQIHGMQHAFVQRRDVGLGPVAIEEDVVRDEIGRQRHLHQNFAEVGRLGIDVHNRDSFATHRLVRLAFVVEQRQQFS